MAIEEIERGLATLSTLGHHYHIEPGYERPEATERWPRYVFHADGRYREVFHPNDLLELGSGWFNTLEEARHRAGEVTQYTGRGGRASKGLPAVISGAERRNNSK
jgi:hypothetical protein